MLGGGGGDGVLIVGGFILFGVGDWIFLGGAFLLRAGREDGPVVGAFVLLGEGDVIVGDGVLLLSDEEDGLAEVDEFCCSGLSGGCPIALATSMPCSSKITSG